MVFEEKGGYKKIPPGLLQLGPVYPQAGEESPKGMRAGNHGCRVFFFETNITRWHVFCLGLLFRYGIRLKVRRRYGIEKVRLQQRMCVFFFRVLGYAVGESLD
jgi:hypothetical protein